MNKNLFSLLIAFALTLTGCLATAPGESTEFESLQKHGYKTQHSGNRCAWAFSKAGMGLIT